MSTTRTLALNRLTMALAPLALLFLAAVGAGPATAASYIGKSALLLLASAAALAIGVGQVVAVVAVVAAVAAGGLTVILRLSLGPVSSGRPSAEDEPGPTPPSYDDEPDVAWAYGCVADRDEPTDELLSMLQDGLAAYADQRARELGRPVRLVGSMTWDTPPLGALPRRVRKNVIATAPARFRRGRIRRRLRPAVTLVRAWQHTDYDELDR